jgi:hypothetical protein
MKTKLSTSQNTQTVTHILQREEIEHELNKSPDFQLYMLTAARHDRERMERLLEKLPAFRMWRRLSQHIEAPAQSVPATSQDPAAPGLRIIERESWRPRRMRSRN